MYVSKKDEPKNSVFVSSKITSQIMTIGEGVCDSQRKHKLEVEGQDKYISWKKKNKKASW